MKKFRGINRYFMVPVVNEKGETVMVKTPFKVKVNNAIVPDHRNFRSAAIEE